MKTFVSLLILLLSIEAFVNASKIFTFPYPTLSKDAANGNEENLKSLFQKFNIRAAALKDKKIVLQEIVKNTDSYGYTFFDIEDKCVPIS